MSRHRVLCKQLSNLPEIYDRIEFIGGLNTDGTRWKISQKRAVMAIISGKWEFFVKSGQHEVKVIVATYNGRKYLKTENDGIISNNLSELPECP